MQITKAAIQDIPQIKQLWNICFEEENILFADSALNDKDAADFYIIKDGDTVVSALSVIRSLEYQGKRGCYIYRLCTHPEYREKADIAALIDYAVKDAGCDFRVMAYTGEDMCHREGFDNIVTLRRCEIEIKRNIWQSADFDIITASRFRPSREKFCSEKLVHYTAGGYGNYAAFMYTNGGSTAENDGAYAVYYMSEGVLEVKEIFALSTFNATRLLQAVRERTGAETAVVYLPENSTLFLGEGTKVPAFVTRGLPDDAYINLMPW